jgi:hypothetical protein
MVTAILLAGMTGAIIDAIYFSSLAIIDGHSPIRTLQGIASFWLGPKSAELGTASALLGLVTHVALATMMAAGFFVVSLRFEGVQGSVVKAGLVYGAFLYLVMYLVVLPLRWPTVFPRWDGWRSGCDVAIHLMIGLAFAILITRSAFGGGLSDPG